MSKVNQLLAKAMSTTSEDEAVACLRMPRKIGGEVSHKPEETGYKGHNAEYWHKKADEYYNFAMYISAALFLTIGYISSL